jgi:hypothetical protein
VHGFPQPGTAEFEREAMKYRNLVLVMSVVLFGYSTLSFLYLSTTTSKAQSLPNRAIVDQVKQYNNAVKAGTPVDRCVQAGFVASAYWQAHDDANSQAWTGIRKDECRAAGLDN